LFGFLNAAFGIQIPNEYWFAPRPGYSQNGLGTLDDPYNGNPSFFDSLINGRPANSTIHLLAGTYQTVGIQMKAGQRILGSGVDVTKLQNTNSNPESVAIFYNDGLGSSVEIADLTIDCNTPQPQTGHGIALVGTRCSVRRVKVINAASINTTSFGIKISSPTNANSDGNIIEDCEVSALQGWGSANAVGISMVAWESYTITGIIRHNRVSLGFNSGTTAYALANSQGFLVEGNFANVCGYGFLYCCGIGDQLLLSHNNFRNCKSGGIQIFSNAAGQNQSNASIIFNQLEVTNSASCVNITASSGGTVKNFVALGNKMRYVNGMSGSGGYGFNLNGVEGFTALNNTIDSTMANNFGTSSKLNIYNNFDFSGGLLTGLNQIAPVAGLTRKAINPPYVISHSDSVQEPAR
jgi:hypothetical protein